MGQRKPSISGWFSNQLQNTSLVWLLGLMIIGVGFYFNTTTKLEELQAALRDQKVALGDSKRFDLVEREKTRDVFLADAKATANGIAELNKQTAILSTTLVGMQRELEKIATRLEAPGRPAGQTR